MADYEIHGPRPGPLVFVPPGSTTSKDRIFTIHPDGRIDIDEKYKPDEAAKLFWESVERLSPMKNAIAAIQARKAIYERKRDEANPFADLGLNRHDMHKFAVECFNELLYDLGVEGVPENE